MSDEQIAVRALRSLDLTDLNETCSDQAIDALCGTAAFNGTWVLVRNSSPT